MEIFTQFLFQARNYLVVLILGITLFFSFNLKGFELDNTLKAWFPEENSDYVAYQDFREDFSGNRNLIIAVKANDVFSPRLLDYVIEKTEAIEDVEYVSRVYSLSTTTRITGGGDGIEVKPLLHGMKKGNLQDIRDYVLKNEIFKDDLVSSDGTMTTILVTFEEESADRERAHILRKIRDIMEEDTIDGVEVFYSGTMEISKEYDRFTLQNQRDYVLPVIILISISIILLFRSFSKLLIVIIVAAASLVWTIGIYTRMGYSLNVISGMLIPLVGFLSISDSIHILEYYDEVSRKCKERKQRFISTLSYITFPCLATSLTTSLGLLSLMTSDVPALRTFGLGAAIGIMSAFAISIVLVPFFLYILPSRYRTFKESVFLGPLEALHRFNQRNARYLFLEMIGITIFSIVGISRLEVNTNQIEFFEEESEVRKAAILLNEKLSGVVSVEVHLRGDNGSMKEPETLLAVERLSERLLENPRIRKVFSLADQVKLINRELHDGDPAEYRIPDDSDLIAQELLLLSLSRRGRDELLNIVTSDYSSGRISIKVESMSSDELVDICRIIEREAEEAFAENGVTPTVTGSGQLFSSLDKHLVDSQIRSFALAFTTVLIFMFIFFRSWKYGFLSIIPNLFPIVIVLGFMGVTGITLNVATVTVASVALGIAADDTIHFISRLKRERREISQDRVKALKNTTLHAGRAIASTSLINVLGFSILMYSDFVPTVYFGALVALTMTLALVGDLVYLPSKLLIFWREGNRVS